MNDNSVIVALLAGGRDGLQVLGASAAKDDVRAMAARLLKHAPTDDNPLTAALSKSRRQALVALAGDHDQEVG